MLMTRAKIDLHEKTGCMVLLTIIYSYHKEKSSEIRLCESICIGNHTYLSAIKE